MGNLASPFPPRRNPSLSDAFVPSVPGQARSRMQGAARLSLAVVVFAGMACAQTPDSFGAFPQQSASKKGIPPSVMQPLPDANAPTPQMQRLMEKQIRLRNAERQKKMVEDTKRLVALATELKTSMDQTARNTPSPDVIQKADEIERLAKSVKDKMRTD